jgi:pyruvate formate lyase activating enzyme
MKILLRKTSLVDYPGKVASVLFFTGCNLRCPWCHNRDLVLSASERDGLIPLEDALSYLKKRRSVLGGVVLSGGEPTLLPSLPALVARIKEVGLLVKLDTNGMLPQALENMASAPETSPDYIALDLKVSPDRYAALLPDAPFGGKDDPAERIKRSAALISASGIPHEYRSIALPNFFTEEDIDALAPLVDAAPWYIRSFRAGNCLDPLWDTFESPGTDTLAALVKRAQALGKNASSPGIGTG